jgi:hypothetical protein
MKSLKLIALYSFGPRPFLRKGRGEQAEKEKLRCTHERNMKQ